MPNKSIVNPSSNKIGAGVTEEDVAAAVAKSGYPLQTIVAGYCEDAGFGSIEEWSYIDKDSNQLRTIDVKAEKPFQGHRKSVPDCRVRPALVLLIECKQSQLPYVFFLSRHPIRISHFPFLAGLHQLEIAITTDDDQSTYNVGVLGALGLESRRFVVSEPEYCSSFSKCVRKGDGLELSGSEPFLSLVSPLVKSLQHFQVAVTPPKTAAYFDLYLTLAVAVVDAPMLGVYVQESNNQIVPVPWVRTVRHEYFEGALWERGRAFAVDIVHRDYFKIYVEQYAEPFAAEFSERAIKHHRVLASGKGFVSGMRGRGTSRILKVDWNHAEHPGQNTPLDLFSDDSGATAATRNRGRIPLWSAGESARLARFENLVASGRGLGRTARSTATRARRGFGADHGHSGDLGGAAARDVTSY